MAAILSRGLRKCVPTTKLFVQELRAFNSISNEDQKKKGMRIDGPFGALYNKDEEKNYVRWDMPGVRKESVKIYMEEGRFTIKAVGDLEFEDDETDRRIYGCYMEAPKNMYDMDHIKIDFSNGVLKIIIPLLPGRRKEENLMVYSF